MADIGGNWVARTAQSEHIGPSSNGASSGGSTANIATATRQLTASSEDPGTFTPSSNRFWAAATIAVYPAAGGGGGGGSDPLELMLLGVG